MSSPYITLWKQYFLYSLVNVCWCWKLISCSIIHKRLHVHHNCNWKLQRMSTTKFGSNWAYSRAWPSLTIGVWMVIHIVPLRWLLIQLQTHMEFSTPCQSHRLNYVVLCINYLFSANCTYSSIGISSLPIFRKDAGVADSFATSFILNFSRSSSMSKLALQSTSKILDIFICFVWFGDSSLSTFKSTTQYCVLHSALFSSGHVE